MYARPTPTDRRFQLQTLQREPRHSARFGQGALAIINRTNDVMLSTGIAGDLLDFLSKPHNNPDLAKAATEVLENVGTAPES